MKYRKKPVVIEAVRFTGSSTHAYAIKDWMAGRDYVEPGMATCDMRSMTIPTLEGDMTAHPGDYIIRGVKGEFYPCRADIFEQTYEVAE